MVWSIIVLTYTLLCLVLVCVRSMALQSDEPRQPLWHLWFLSPTCNMQGGPERIKPCVLLQPWIYWRWNNVLQWWIYTFKATAKVRLFIMMEENNQPCVCHGNRGYFRKPFLFVIAHHRHTEALSQYLYTCGLIFLERGGWLGSTK